MLRININLFCRKARKKVLIIPIAIVIASCSSHVAYYPLKIKCHKIFAVWQVRQMYPSYEFCVGALKIVKYTVGLGRYSFLWIHTRIYQSTPQFIPISIVIEAWNLKPTHLQLQTQHMDQWKKKMFQLLFRVNLDLENHFQLKSWSNIFSLWPEPEIMAPGWLPLVRFWKILVMQKRDTIITRPGSGSLSLWTFQVMDG